MKHMTRKEALEKGLKYYFVGKKCKHGHLAKMYIYGGCFVCRKARYDRRRVENRDEFNKYMRDYNTPEKGKKYRSTHLRENLLDGAKQRSKRKNWPFNLKKEDIKIPDKCPVLNKPFVHLHKDWGYSLDRIDNSKPYTKNNICVISKRANRLKADSSLVELKQLLNYLNNNR